MACFEWGFGRFRGKRDIYETQTAGNKYFVMAMGKLRNQFATADKDFLNTVIEKAYEIWARNTH